MIMKKTEKIFIFISMLLIFIAIGIFLYFEVGLTALFIYSGAVCLTFALIFFISLFTSKENSNMFNENLDKILKTYDAVLVATSNLPDLAGRDIIKTTSIDNLIDAQLGIRKPIYYKRYDDSCGFVLLGEKEAVVYVMKLDNSVICPLELVIDEIAKNAHKKDYDHELLDDIEKTTVIKLDNEKEYKVSPVRDSVPAEDKDGKDKSFEVEKVEQYEDMPKVIDEE